MAPKETSKHTPATRKTSKPADTPQPISLAHRLHALLHTVRAIAHAEDELCTLLHAAEHAADVSRELRHLLAAMPAHDYVVDLEAVRTSLSRKNPAPGKSTKTPAKRASMVKKTVTIAKKSAPKKKTRKA